MCYSGNPKDDQPLGTKYFSAPFEKVILYFDDISLDKDEMDYEIRVDVDSDGNVRYSSSDPNVGYKMGSEIVVDNDISGDARIKMDYDDELDDYYIFFNEDFF